MSVIYFRGISDALCRYGRGSVMNGRNAEPLK